MRLLVFLATLLFALPAHAIPIAYDEAINGDLDGTQNLILGEGTNTVAGTITFADALESTDFDSFDFNVGPGLHLTSITIDIALLPGGAAVFEESGYMLDGVVSAQIVPIPSSGFPMFAASLPLLSGDHQFIHLSMSGVTGAGEFATAEYTLRLDVVPEPSTALLLVLGLAGLAAARHRRR